LYDILNEERNKILKEVIKMAIQNAGNLGPMLPQNPQNAQNVNDLNVNRKPLAPDMTVNQTPGILDNVVISQQAKTLNAAVNAINNIPDVRTQAVQAAAQQRVVENNRVPAGQLAAKLLLKE
jgi:hypothetical protein